MGEHPGFKSTHASKEKTLVVVLASIIKWLFIGMVVSVYKSIQTEDLSTYSTEAQSVDKKNYE